MQSFTVIMNSFKDVALSLQYLLKLPMDLLGFTDVMMFVLPLTVFDHKHLYATGKVSLGEVSLDELESLWVTSRWATSSLWVTSCWVTSSVLG